MTNFLVCLLHYKSTDDIYCNNHDQNLGGVQNLGGIQNSRKKLKKNNSNVFFSTKFHIVIILQQFSAKKL